MRDKHIEDKNLIVRQFHDVNFSNLEFNRIYSSLINEYNEKFGYNINFIKPLSNIYNVPIYNIQFYYNELGISDTGLVSKRLSELYREIESNYYIMKVPADNYILLESINNSELPFHFNGTNICYYIDHTVPEDYLSDFEISNHSLNDLQEKQEKLKDLSHKSFTNPKGQYSISSFTKDKAPEIYRNWIDDLFKKDAFCVIAKVKGEIIGFLIYQSESYCAEIILNAVDEKYRGIGVYQNLLKCAVNHALDYNNIVTVSTQLDNYGPQSAWINLGFKPYYSFYLYHLNLLNKGV